MDPVLTLRDLAAWSRPGVALAVLGFPIGHSISPALHNAALADLAPGTAVAFTVAESRLHGVVSDTRGRYVVVRVGAHQHWVTRDRLVVEGRR